MHLYVIWALLLVSSSSAYQNGESHHDSHLLSIFPATDDHHDTLQNLLAERSGCELLKYPRLEGMPVDVLCHGVEARALKELLQSSQLPFISFRSEESEEDEENDTKEMTEEEKPGPLNHHIRYRKHNRYDDIQLYIKKLATDFPNFVKLESASVKATFEERELNYLRIGTNPAGENTRMVWIDAGIHAREWISVSTALYTIDQLVRVFKKKSEATETLSSTEEDLVAVNWLIMPLLNPDGYEYSHTNRSREFRLWRKNRSPQADSCYGVDLNRNFDVVGYGTGHPKAVSKNPCEDPYIGTGSNTEQEVKMASEIMMANKDKIRVALSLHCYGSYILTPYAYTNATPSDSQRMVDFGNRLYGAIQTFNPQRNYTVGACGSIFFYTAGGSTLDYYKATANIPFVATIELPGHYLNGTRFPDYVGFHTPKDQRMKVLKEIWAAMPEAARTARDEPLNTDSYQ